MMQDDLNEKKAARWDQLVAEGKPPEEAQALVEREFGSSEKPGMVKGVVREAAAGLLPGIATRAEAAVRAIGLETYKGSLDKIVKERTQFQGEHPGAAIASNIVGSVPTMFIPGIGMGKAAQQATLIGKVLNAAKTGAKAGAIYSGLETYDGDYLGGVGKGAVLGAMAGPVGAGVGAGVGKVINAVRKAGQSSLQRVASNAGPQKLLEMVGEARGITPEKAATVLERAAGAGTPEDPRINADLAPELGGALRAVRGTSPETSRLVQNRVVRARSGKSGQRTLDKLAAALGFSPEDAAATADDIVTRRAADALKGYEAAFNVGEVTDEPTLALYKQLQESFPEAKAAGHESMKLAYDASGRKMPTVDPVAKSIADAVDAMKAAGLSTPKQFMAGISQMFPKATPVQIAEGLAGAQPKPPTVEELHFFKQGVDRVIRKKNSLANNEVPLAKTDTKNAVDLQEQFLAALDNAVPEYGSARGQFADESKLLDALERGREMYRRPGASGTRDVTRERAGLKPGPTQVPKPPSAAEDEMLRLGAFDAARENLLQSGIGDEGLRNLFGAKITTGQINRPDRLRKMLQLIPESERNNFEKYLRQELAGAETSSLMGNSQTAEKLREQAAMEASAPGISSVLQGGSPSRLAADEIEALLKNHLKGLKKGEADAIGEVLLTPLSNEDARRFFTEIARSRASNQKLRQYTQAAPAWLGGAAAGNVK